MCQQFFSVGIDFCMMSGREGKPGKLGAARGVAVENVERDAVNHAVINHGLMAQRQSG
jgi:hypothetical protein